MRKLQCALILTFVTLLPLALYADKLVMNDETILEGVIISDAFGRIEFQMQDRIRFIDKSEIRQIIWRNRQMRISKWGGGFDFGTGYGHFTGRMNEYFSDHIPLLVGFDIGYEAWRLQLRNYIGLGMNTKQSFTYDGTWQQGLDTQIIHPEASVGYEFAIGANFAVIPFFGIASMHIAPPEKVRDTPGNDVALPFSTAIPMGLNYEYRFPDHTDSANKVDGTLAAYWIIRLRVAYVIGTFDGYDPRFAGNMVYFTISFGAYIRARSFEEKPILEDI
ncbi:hypothetical protein [Turneriella parva]|uniref:Outer membrane protein beta-barrel domain-containing protein n=1 Tax=Turneriella parva (strain ATCC BAA-1111 / DSM 21527 / NCTC 11395 / H) TaxID=869212 RepID=I4B3U3_TURPD|nr:hypothetical protein [Turneriella parva]AFM11950.1 hypothetical protein Turpa_1302 [Turneriella parva DSM 21527]